MRAYLILSYVGTRFAGWQRQPNALAVQQVLEEALERWSGEPARTVGAGRTDAGVHALGQVASIELAREWPDSALVEGTNHHLPEEIRVVAAGRAPGDFDARRHAAAKLYRYRVDRRPPTPERLPFVVPLREPVDPGRLAAAARLLVGSHDFGAFALAGGAARTSRRRIHAAAWEESGSELVFRIAGEGFLRGMVRSLVGTLLEIGQGRRALEELVRLLEGGERSQSGPTAPARGLCLERVDYPPGMLGAPPALW